MSSLISCGGFIWKVALAGMTLVTLVAIARRWNWFAALYVSAVVCMFWYQVLVFVGQRILPARTSRLDRVPARLLLAAAFPGTRDEIRQRLLRAEPTLDDAGLAFAIGRARLLGECPSKIYAAYGRLDEARLADCDGDERDYAYELGEFARARPTLVGLIANSRWAEAAHLVHDPCLASLFRVWSGERVALSRLDLHDKDGRCRAIAYIAREQPLRFTWRDYDPVAQKVAWAADLLSERPEEAAALPHAWTARRPSREDVWARSYFLGTTRFEGLRRHAPLRAPTWHMRWDLDWASPPRLDDDPLLHPCPSADALQQAQNGDGLVLAEELRTCGIWEEEPRIIRWLGDVTAHRAELADALRAIRSDDKHLSPFTLIERYAEYRDRARLIRDLTDARRWDAAIQRFAAMLGDRRRAQAFAILAI